MVVETMVKFVDGGFTITQILHSPKTNAGEQKSNGDLENDAKLPDGEKKGSSVGTEYVPPSGDKGAGVYGSTDPGGGNYGSTDPGGSGPGFGGVTIIFGNLTTGCRCSDVAVAAETKKGGQATAPAQGAAPAQSADPAQSAAPAKRAVPAKKGAAPRGRKT